MDEKLYTVKEMAQILHLSEKTVYYYFYSGKGAQHFVRTRVRPLIEKGHKNTKLYVKESFIDFYKKSKITDEEFAKLMDLNYKFYELAASKRGINPEDTARVVKACVEILRECDEEGVLEGYSDKELYNVIVNGQFHTVERSRKIGGVMKKALVALEVVS